MLYVAAQGNPWGPNKERGVFRSQDGGKTWKKILYVNDETGSNNISMDATNPRILYATMWDHGRKPWHIRSGGKGSGLYKSTDGGDNWEKLTKGLPDIMGKIGVAVSAANPNRVYAIIEAEYDKRGLYRSDNAGKSWSLINEDHKLHARS